MLSAKTLSTFAVLASAVYAAPSSHGAPAAEGRLAQCTTDNYNVSVSATNLDIPFSLFEDQLTLTGNLLPFLSPTGPKPTITNKEINTTYTIAATYCAPSDFDTKNGTLALAVHGFDGDRRYWDVDYNRDLYSYVESAARRGQAVFFYDRLGVGESQAADGLVDTQIAVNIEVAHGMAQIARQNFKFARLVGIGHSYGSITVARLTTKYPKDLDAIVLTGFSASDDVYSLALAIGFSLTPAKVAEPLKFGDRNHYTVATSTPNAEQVIFFSYPNFEFKAFQWFVENRAIVSIGEFLSLAPTDKISQNFTGSVLVITGTADYPFCQIDCSKKFNGTSMNVVEASTMLFPKAVAFKSIMVEGAGHALNLHTSAPDTFGKIGSWIAALP